MYLSWNNLNDVNEGRTGQQISLVLENEPTDLGMKDSQETWKPEYC